MRANKHLGLSLPYPLNYSNAMTTMTIELPDQIAEDAKGFIKAGFFRSEKEIMLAALVDFLRRNRTELMDRFAHEDIEWAKRETHK